MAASYVVAQGGRGTNTAGTTLYLAFGMCHTANPSTTEAPMQTPVRRAGTASNLRVVVSGNNLSTASTVALRRDTGGGAASTALTVSIPGGGTGTFSDTTDTVSVNAGDKLDYQIAGGSGTTFTPNVIQSEWRDATDGTTNTTLVASGQGAAISSASATAFVFLAGQFGSTNPTAPNVSTIVRTANGTFRNLAVYVSANARGTGTTFGMRDGATNNSPSLSVGASATGLFEDTSGTFSPASGDAVCYRITTGTGTGSITPVLLKCEFTTTDGTALWVTGSLGGVLVQNANLIRYTSALGLAIATSETNAMSLSGRGPTLSHLHIVVFANTVTAASTVTARIAGANGSQALSVTASTTGLFEDTTHSDATTKDQSVGTQIVTGSTGTSLSYTVLAYNVAAGGIATSSSQEVWSARALATASSQEKWNLRALLHADSVERWNLRARVGAASQEVWTARALAGRQDQVRWAVRGAAGSQVAALWNLAAVVGGSSGLEWIMRALVAGGERVDWRVRAPVMREPALEWDVRELAGLSGAMRWRLQAVASRSRDLRWNLRAGVPAESGLTWAVLERTLGDLSLGWGIGGPVDAEIRFVWKTATGFLLHLVGRHAGTASLVGSVARDVALAGVRRPVDEVEGSIGAEDLQGSRRESVSLIGRRD